MEKVQVLEDKVLNLETMKEKIDVLEISMANIMNTKSRPTTSTIKSDSINSVNSVHAAPNKLVITNVNSDQYYSSSYGSSVIPQLDGSILPSATYTNRRHVQAQPPHQHQRAPVLTKDQLHSHQSSQDNIRRIREREKDL